MINKTHLRKMVYKVLVDSNTYSQAALNIVLGTIATESQAGTFFYQLGEGPALGFGQIEPATERDIWRYLNDINHNMRNVVVKMTGVTGPNEEELLYNLKYQILLIRIKYWMQPEPLPPAGDIFALGEYYKKYYNTAGGKGSAEKFVIDFKNMVA